MHAVNQRALSRALVALPQQMEKAFNFRYLDVDKLWKTGAANAVTQPS
jgi:hypothetical protein